MNDEVTIAELGAQGDGVTADGVFVPGTLPGERARVHGAGHRASLLALTHTSPDRVDPVCAHFGTCGACTLQHASDGLLAGWKRDLVHRALAARNLTGVEIRPVITSPPRSRRRATFTARRMKKGVVIGYHSAASDQIVPITECHVADRRLLAVLPALTELVSTGASRKGELRMTVTASDAGLDIAVTGGKPVEGPLYGQLVAIVATADLARLSWDGELIVNRRPPAQRMGKAQVVPPPGGFLQATEQAQAVLQNAVRLTVGQAERVADLFCGSGTFALPMAENAEVHAVDSEQAALDALDAGWRHAEGLKRITTEARDLLRRPLLTRELDGFDAIVFDPPRQGARAQVEQIGPSGVNRISAISCNPATFARDARMLVDAGFSLDWVQPVDQFLWSPHIELAAAFHR